MNTLKKLEQTESDIAVKKTDYIGNDGLLYCGVCNTQKQIRICFLGKEKTPGCLCQCQIQKREEENQRRAQKEHLAKIAKRRIEAFSEPLLHSWNFDNDDGSNQYIIYTAQKYVDNFDQLLKEGKGLLLYGTVGTGKTYAAACIANALIDKGYSVLMTNFARIANIVTGMNSKKQEYYDGLNNYSLLILDDLCAERQTEYMREIIHSVIDARYRAGLPIIITTNLTATELKHPAELSYQRVFSRLFEMCFPIEVINDDKRIDKLEKQLPSFKKLFEL